MFIYIVPFRKLVVKAVFLFAAICLVAYVFISKKGTIRVFSSGRKLPIYSVETEEKTVSLTFDCAWGADDIPRILDTLKQAEVKATFFIVGQWAEKYPEAVRQIAAAGHDVANHGYSHLRMGALKSDRIEKEIARCNEVLKNIAGVMPDLFRPPYGDYSNNVVEIARQNGCFTIQWDVDSLDWKPGIAAEEIISRVLRKARNGSIILFHNDTVHTARILPLIINSLKKDGYSFTPVSGLILRQDYEMGVDGRQKSKKGT